MADIPGLISGASEGKGLGHKFLRHITRTSLILHCVSAENEDVAVAYKTIRAELSAYNDELTAKPEIVILTKTDTTSEAEVKIKMKALSKVCGKKAEITEVSILDPESLKKVAKMIVSRLQAKD